VLFTPKMIDCQSSDAANIEGRNRKSMPAVEIFTV